MKRPFANPFHQDRRMPSIGRRVKMDESEEKREQRLRILRAAAELERLGATYGKICALCSRRYDTTKDGFIDIVRCENCPPLKMAAITSST